MGLSQRMSHLRRSLLNLRVGPGAAILPQDVKTIHLDFAFKAAEGHLGGRKAWREIMPRLKYHNPTLAVTVDRKEDQFAPCVMTLGWANGRKETIDMKDRKVPEIVEQLLELTKATPIIATAAEEAEFQRIAEQEIKSEEQRVQMRMDKEEKEREERLLAQARGQIVDAAQ